MLWHTVCTLCYASTLLNPHIIHPNKCYYHFGESDLRRERRWLCMSVCETGPGRQDKWQEDGRTGAVGRGVHVWERHTQREHEKDTERKREGVGVCEAVQVCAVLMLVCLMKRGEPMWEKFKSCVSGIGAGGLGKVFKYHNIQAWISLSVCASWQCVVYMVI